MSHDRGCHCGKEPYEYRDCRDVECSRGPVYDATLHHKRAMLRRAGKPIPVEAPVRVYRPPTPPTVVRQADFNKRVLLVGQEGGRHAETLPVGGEAAIAGPCRVRLGRGGRMEVIVNHGIDVRWTPAGKRANKASSNNGGNR